MAAATAVLVVSGAAYLVAIPAMFALLLPLPRAGQPAAA
jgi:hypothetical protein